MAHPVRPADPAGNWPTAGVDRLWTVRPGVLAGVIHGPLPNKSNSRKIVTVRGRAMVIKSEEARKYEAQFEDACWRSTQTLSQLPDGEKLYFRVVVYQQDLRRDLDCELLPDLLQKFKIIGNDRAIWKKDYLRKLDKVAPRVEFEVGVWDSANA